MRGEAVAALVSRAQPSMERARPGFRDLRKLEMRAE